MTERNTKRREGSSRLELWISHGAADSADSCQTDLHESRASCEKAPLQRHLSEARTKQAKLNGPYVSLNSFDTQDLLVRGIRLDSFSHPSDAHHARRRSSTTTPAHTVDIREFPPSAVSPSRPPLFLAAAAGVSGKQQWRQLSLLLLPRSQEKRFHISGCGCLGWATKMACCSLLLVLVLPLLALAKRSLGDVLWPSSRLLPLPRQQHHPQVTASLPLPCSSSRRREICQGFLCPPCSLPSLLHRRGALQAARAAAASADSPQTAGAGASEALPEPPSATEESAAPPQRAAEAASRCSRASAAASAAVAEGLELGRCMRPLFPLLAANTRIIPFDNAATTHKPQIVIQDIKTFSNRSVAFGDDGMTIDTCVALRVRRLLQTESRVYRQLNANIHRGSYRLATAATEAVEDVREKLARYVGGDAEEIIFTSGATAGINLVARAWGDAFLEEGAEVLVSVAEHHANLVPWQQLAQRKKAHMKYIPLERHTGILDVKRAVSLLSPRSQVLAVACVSNVLGSFVRRQQLQQLMRAAKKAHPRLITLVDATQALAHALLDARSLGADFLVGSGHKMYGGSGVGFLWGRKEILQQMPPDSYGGEMIERVSLSGSSFAAAPWRYEAGTLPIAQIVGLGAALDFLQDIAAADKKLSKTLMEAVRSLPRARILSVDPWRQEQHVQGVESAAAVGGEFPAVPLCSFVIEGLSPFDVALCIDQWYHVHVRAGHHCAQPLHEEILGASTGSLRASLAVYNTQEDVHRCSSAAYSSPQRSGSSSTNTYPAARYALEEVHDAYLKGVCAFSAGSIRQCSRPSNAWMPSG
ncbi:selenocysteine [Cyclospora cayetanensis]|uniref:cysteine desulfurase n=1 Tax=Cyclospora cayetanensis TaxID=88456 RepID=A0A1D3D0Y7_9EIME|nr:selenocysteine [Cyclospora cayetanensis]